MGKLAVDLCCGVGGMSLGFSKAGFDVAVAVDNEPINCEYHKLNFPSCEVLQRDLKKLSGKEIRKEGNLGRNPIELVFGGPPCQGFSLMGHRNTEDPRSTILHEFTRIAVELNPNVIVIENVLGLASGFGKDHLELVKVTLQTSGYKHLQVLTLNAADFGVPQARKRIFVIASKRPVSTDSLTKRIVVKTDVMQAIGDLTGHSLKSDYVKSLTDIFGQPVAKKSEIENNSFPNHTARVTKRFQSTAPGGTEPISRYPRLSWYGLCPTIRAGTLPDKGSFMAARPIHPDGKRCITVREAARLHSYPDSFAFHPTHWHGFRQIGNSVPPMLAYFVAKAII